MTKEPCEYGLHCSVYLKDKDRHICAQCGKEWLPPKEVCGKENHIVSSEPKRKYGTCRPAQFKGDECGIPFNQGEFCKKCWDEGKGCASCEEKDCPSNQDFCECKTKDYYTKAEIDEKLFSKKAILEKTIVSHYNYKTP